jgi:hypothetical protein
MTAERAPIMGDVARAIRQRDRQAVVSILFDASIPEVRHRTPEELYPDREDLARDYSHRLSTGWWFSVNYGSKQIKNKILHMAAEAQASSTTRIW